MERLTKKHYLGIGHYMKCCDDCNVDMDCIDCPSFGRLVERLAAYEDTGLTPEQCENAKVIIESAFSDDTSKAERIRELLKADKDERWVHLGGDEWCCSACGFVISTEGSWEKPDKKYCEDCGAKMDGGLI